MLSQSRQLRLEYQHESINEMIKGFSEEELRKRPSTGKWSPFENIVHLATYQPVFLNRLLKIQKEDSPALERYIADNDPAFDEYLKKSLKEILEFISTQRFIIINHVRQLNEAAFRRTAAHPVYGRRDTSFWIEFFLLHEAHHLFTIFKLICELDVSGTKK